MFPFSSCSAPKYGYSNLLENPTKRCVNPREAQSSAPTDESPAEFVLPRHISHISKFMSATNWSSWLGGLLFLGLLSNKAQCASRNLTGIARKQRPVCCPQYMYTFWRHHGRVLRMERGSACLEAGRMEPMIILFLEGTIANSCEPA